jgi:predicted DNA-binding protein
MKATTAYIRVDQDKDLRALSAKTKVPAAEYIRQGIEAVLERNQHLLEEPDGNRTVDLGG